MATSEKDYHYEVYFHHKTIGWFLGGYRDEESEAEKYGKKEKKAGEDITGYQLKRKRNSANTVNISVCC